MNRVSQRQRFKEPGRAKLGTMTSLFGHQSGKQDGDSESDDIARDEMDEEENGYDGQNNQESSDDEHYESGEEDRDEEFFE